MPINNATPSKQRCLLVSIIIPTHNRPGLLQQCLLSLVGLDADRSLFEVVVIDDGSDIDCQAIVAENASDLQWSFLRQVNQGPATARNLGAKHAKGRFLAFLDDDCTLPKNWFSNLSPFLDEQEMLGGHTENMLTKNIFSVASHELIEYLYSYYRPNSCDTRFITSNNMIIPRFLFQDIGGFSTQFRHPAAEDREFCDRWLWKGHLIRYVPQIRVEHRHALNFRQFLRQHFSYGYGARFYHVIKVQRRGSDLRIESPSFYLKLILFPFSKARSLRAFLLSLCLCLSQVCIAAGYFMAKTTGPVPSDRGSSDSK
jgi:glycosyltransferase involved in cell wall biosynthesis